MWSLADYNWFNKKVARMAANLFSKFVFVWMEFPARKLHFAALFTTRTYTHISEAYITMYTQFYPRSFTVEFIIRSSREQIKSPSTRSFAKPKQKALDDSILRLFSAPDYAKTMIENKHFRDVVSSVAPAIAIPTVKHWTLDCGESLTMCLSR